MKKVKLPIIDRKEIAEDTYEIRFGLDEDFEYNAGQYITIKIDKSEVTDKRGSVKSFSISSSPNNKKFISTCFRLPDKHSDFKEYLTKAPLGSHVEINGPHGVFMLPETTDKGIVMIAGGVGITPFIGMIRYSTENNTGHIITLLYTDKSEKRIAYYDELVKLEKKNENFDFSSRFKRVDEDYIKKHCNLKKSIFYLCGTPGMVKGVKEMLINLGVEKKNIKFENFTGY